MAFCTSCGATLEPTSRFCTKCGAANPSVSATPAAGVQARPAQTGVPTAQTAGSSSALKIILIVFAVIVVLGVVSVVGMLIAARMFIHRARVETRGNHARVVTPFGT